MKKGDQLTLVVAGRSGSGKGTQAKFILDRLGVYAHHMETGRFLRHLLHKPNPTTLRARTLMQEGRLLPAWLGAFSWLKELVERGYGDKHLVFDGAPRHIWEAELLDDVMAWHGRLPSLCIYMDVSAREATRRLRLRKRADDNVSAIRNRMQYFAKNVLPVMRYYRVRGRLIHIDGNASPEVVSQEIDRILARRIGKKWSKR